MEKIDWNNDTIVEHARKYFDKYVSARNSQDAFHRGNTIYQSPLDDPCFLDMHDIFIADLAHDYEEFFKQV